jgi:hypothetical protein
MNDLHLASRLLFQYQREQPKLPADDVMTGHAVLIQYGSMMQYSPSEEL